jgi:hypothetical protein
VQRFNLWKLNELEVRKQYHINISIKFADLEKLRNSGDINRSSENKQHIKYQNEECLHFLDQRKQAELQWLQDPNQCNVGNVKMQEVSLVSISGTKRENI